MFINEDSIQYLSNPLKKIRDQRDGLLEKSACCASLKACCEFAHNISCKLEGMKQLHRAVLLSSDLHVCAVTHTHTRPYTYTLTLTHNDKNKVEWKERKLVTQLFLNETHV